MPGSSVGRYEESASVWVFRHRSESERQGDPRSRSDLMLEPRGERSVSARPSACRLRRRPGSREASPGPAGRHLVASRRRGLPYLRDDCPRSIAAAPAKHRCLALRGLEFRPSLLEATRIFLTSSHLFLLAVPRGVHEPMAMAMERAVRDRPANPRPRPRRRPRPPRRARAERTARSSWSRRPPPAPRPGPSAACRGARTCSRAPRRRSRSRRA